MGARHLLNLFCAALLALPFHASAMGSDPERLRLTYQGEAYRAWPVVYSLTFNGIPNVAPQSSRCCLGTPGAPGDGSGAGITLLYEGARPDIELDVIWIEVHSGLTYRARIAFAVDEIDGWSGGDVSVTLSFRPGGELVLIVDGPALAATRPGADVEITSGDDLRAVLLAPGLGRAHMRSDYKVLRRKCATVDPDPPDGFTDGRASFAPTVLDRINADAALPLPAPHASLRNERDRRRHP